MAKSWFQDPLELSLGRQGTKNLASHTDFVSADSFPLCQVLLGTSVNISTKLKDLIEFDNEAKTYLHLTSFLK